MSHRCACIFGGGEPRSRHGARPRWAACCTLLVVAACGSKNDSGVSNGSSDAGAADAGGNAGRGGASAGSGGSSGTNAGTPSGTVQVLSTDGALRGPTTAAVRAGDLWVVNGQQSGLSGGPLPTLPFNVVALPLTGGAIRPAVIELPGDTFYPQGIAAAADGTLYVASLNLGTIVKVAPDTTLAVPFVAANVAERGAMGLTVDETRGLLWFCDSSPVASVPGAAIVGVSLEDGTETVRHVMPDRAPLSSADAAAETDTAAGAAFCHDVLVDPTGNLFASDSSGRIFRVPAADALLANRAQVWLEVPEIAPPLPGGGGAQGLELVAGSLIISSHGLVQVNPTSENPASTVHGVRLTRDGAPETLCGPDGLRAVPGSNTDLIVVENGSCNRLSGNGSGNGNGSGSSDADGDRVVRITLAL